MWVLLLCERPDCPTSRHIRPIVPAPPAGQRRRQDLAVHPRDDVQADTLRTHRLAFTMQRAAAEAFAIGGCDHRPGATRTLGLSLRQRAEVRDLRTHEQRRRAVWTRGHAR